MAVTSGECQDEKPIGKAINVSLFFSVFGFVCIVRLIDNMNYKSVL